MDILTPSQTRLLTEFSRSSLNDFFFLTGGTALSAFYLHHRLSEDLDFFTEQPGQVQQVLPILNTIAEGLGLRVELRRQFASYLEVFLHEPEGETIKCDFAQDSPFRHQPKMRNSTLGFFVDNPLDIACNKLSALFDRAAAKDFVDVYFIDKELLPFKDLLSRAREKHIGIDDYWLAIALQRVQNIGPMPRMVKPLNKEEVIQFFLAKARWLMEKE